MDFHHQKISSGMHFEDFLRTLYPKQDKYRVAAAHFIAIIAEQEGIDGYELSKLCNEKEISRATMQKVFKRMRALGLIERRSMKYYLNNEFATATRRLGDAWKNMNKNNKFEFNEDLLKVNL